jgi:hypothetical protein
VPQFYDGVDCPCPPGSARRFPVSAGFETSGIEFSLKKSGTIGGTVRRATGEPLTGVEIVVRNLQGEIVQQVQSVGGAYAARGLTPGQYFIETLSYGLALVDQIHPGRNCVPAPCTTAMGQPVTIATFGSTVDGIDFSLQQYKTISGTIRNSTGHPAALVSVDFVRADESDLGTTTDANGVYHSPPLPPGAYFVRVNPTGLYDGAFGRHLDPFRNHRPRGPEPRRSQQRLISGHVHLPRTVVLRHRVRARLAPHSLSERQAHLRHLHPLCASRLDAGGGGREDRHRHHAHAEGVISGAVTDAATGKPIEDAQVFFTRDGQFAGNTFTEADGRYRWPYGEGSYNVHAEPYSGEKFTAQV